MRQADILYKINLQSSVFMKSGMFFLYIGGH